MHRWGNKKDMAGDDPPFLSVGTEVSAKYKGAFCEAKIRKVVKSVKCKVQYKNEQGSVFVNDEQIKGLLMSGASVEVKLPDKESIEGTIVKIQDLSQYTVVFDDGDIATLRRTALCLKSGRHFAESETLDQLPLTHPEHFSSPVVSGARGSRRRDDMDENSDDEEKHQKIKREEDMGKVVCIEIGDKKKSKDNWFPGLIVAPNAQDSVKIDVEDEYLVRSFKDGRYYTVPKSETVEFTREMNAKIENPTLRQAVEKAILFLDKSDLPAHWDRDQLFGIVDFPSDIDASDTDSMDDEPREEKDHFVAQLYKFMDDRGTPINKGPMISSRDVDLYKLFKIVYKLGGYNRVTNRNQWKCVAIKSGYNVSQTNNVKSSYKKYLHSFEDFYRKLGCTLLTTSRDNKLRSRSSRPLIRDRDKTVSEKPLEKEETPSLNNEDACVAKQANSVRGKSLEVLAKNAEDVDCKNFEVKKENVKKNRDPNANNSKEQKNDNNNIDPFTVQLVNFKDIKEDKLVPEERAERKSMKLISKSDEASYKKMADRFSFKTKTKKTKSVEKRIKKTEGVLSQLKEKRSLKERIKAVVNKLKLKSLSSSDQDKKKQKAEELNKLLSQGQRVKLKEDYLKSRKLSLGSGDGKSSTSSDKKFGGSSNSINSLSESTSSSSGSSSKPKKNDEDEAETSRKKITSRKKKDDDKLSSTSSESLLNQAIEFVPHYKTICIGDKLKVYYEPTHESKVTYEAKVTNKRYGLVTEYLVHYTGWNTRYDEWIRRSRIADNLSWTPSRSKRKPNQPDLSLSNQTPSVQAEPQNLQNQSNGKPEKTKRFSMSPIPKNRNKISVKSGMKQMKSIKSRLESKSKKSALKKHSDTGSDSGDENKKELLQKTRSRTEKQKMQDGDGDVKKRTTPLKRTRSKSIKLGNKVTKKRKLSSSTAGKMSKGSNIRSSIMKAFVPRKRAYNRSKNLKDKKERRDTSLTNELTDDDIENGSDFSIPEIKPCSSDLDKTKYASDIFIEMEVEDNLILKLRPITPDKIVREISDDENITLSDNKEMSQSTDDITSKKVLVKKESINEEENGINQHLADSYLAENITITKPKIIKSQLKKEVDEKNISPLKSTSRTLEKSTVGKYPSEVKEKTIFTSRSPSEKKNEKTPEKEVKLRSISTFSSYLNIEKIDSIKKNMNVDKAEKPEKPNLILKTSDFTGDDIYEFKEPEPLVIDDRAILHRRTTRFFEDNSYKRIKPVMSAVDSVIKEIDEPGQLLEDMNIVETKPISVPCKEVLEIIENTKDDFTNEKIVGVDTRSSSDIKEKNAGSEGDRVQEVLSKSDIKLELISTTQSVEESNNIRLPVLTCKEYLKGTDLVKSEKDDDGDEVKLIISETDLGNGSEKNSSRKPLCKGMSNVDLIIDSVAIDKSFSDCEWVKIKSSIDRSRVSDNKFNVQGTATVTNDSVPKKIVLLEERKSAVVSCDDEKRPEPSNVEVCDKVTKKSTINSNHTVRRPNLSSINSCHSTHRESCGDDAESKPADETISQGDVLNRVKACSVNRIEMKTEEKMDVEEIVKLKDDENTEDDGLLLCEETIPKSPEIKEEETSDVDLDFMNSGTKKPTTQLVKLKKEAKFENRNVFGESPPITPGGSQSTPGMSPSDERENVTASAFTLNEKSLGSNKDSSENEMISDTSGKRAKSQQYSNEAYTKNNSCEFDTYLKRKTDQDGSSKSEDGERKKIKNNAAVNGNDKKDSNDARTESSITHSNPSVASILEEIPAHYDSNQRIEFLEQKLQQIRNKYNEYKQEVAVIDKKRKKLKRREREGRMMTRNEANSLL